MLPTAKTPKNWSEKPCYTPRTELATESKTESSSKTIFPIEATKNTKPTRTCTESSQKTEHRQHNTDDQTGGIQPTEDAAVLGTTGGGHVMTRGEPPSTRSPALLFCDRHRFQSNSRSQRGGRDPYTDRFDRRAGAGHNMETRSPALARGTRGGAGDLKRGLFFNYRNSGGGREARWEEETAAGLGQGGKDRRKKGRGRLCFRNRGRSWPFDLCSSSSSDSHEEEGLTIRVSNIYTPPPFGDSNSN